MLTDVPAYLAGRDVYLDTAFTLGHLPDEEFVALVRAHGAEHVFARERRPRVY